MRGYLGGVLERRIYDIQMEVWDRYANARGRGEGTGRLEVQYIQYVGAKVRGAREQGVDVTIGRIG